MQIAEQYKYNFSDQLPDLTTPELPIFEITCMEIGEQNTNIGRSDELKSNTRYVKASRLALGLE